MAIDSFDATRMFATVREPLAVVHRSRIARDAPWAHVSGWAQLSGTPSRVSFVMVSRNAQEVLRPLLPEISDSLTEIGFPWEIAIVDNASEDGSSELLMRWSEVPGFSWLRLERDFGETHAACVGLLEARGDAVIVANAGAPTSIEHLPEMVERWRDGSTVVSVEWSEESGSHVVAWSLDVTGSRAPASWLSTFTGAQGDLVLLDREVVEGLLRSNGASERAPSRPA